jgi:hypothetical protein
MRWSIIAVVVLACSLSVKVALAAGKVDAAAPGADSGRVLPRVTVQEPAVDGEMDPALVSARLQLSIVKIVPCYQAVVNQVPVPEGHIEAVWKISPKGKVMRLEKTKDEVGNQKLAYCLLRVLAGIHFPMPLKGSVDVVARFAFDAAPETAK